MIERAFIEQGIKKIELEEFLKKELDKAGFTKLDIVKTPMVTRIVVNVTRPGLAIGKSGQNIKQLTEAIGKKFGLENPQLEIKEIANPNLDAQSVANRLRLLIERGFSWRSVVYRTVKDVMDSKAQGVEIVLSGKLTGKGGRKRQQRIAYGYMKKVGEQTRLVDYAKASAYPKAGAIGIKVKIVKPETVFPDKINIRDFLNVPEGKKEEGRAAEQKPVPEEEATAVKKAEEDSGKKAEEKTEAAVEKKPEEKIEEIPEKKPAKEAVKKRHDAGKKPGGKEEKPAKKKEKKAAENKGKAKTKK